MKINKGNRVFVKIVQSFGGAKRYIVVDRNKLKTLRLSCCVIKYNLYRIR